MRQLHASVLVLIVSVGLQGCAHTPAKKITDPKVYLDSVCSIGRDVKSVSGSVWLKAKSKEASGQFPASVKAEAPGLLNVEVTNLLGGTEATIRIENNSYRIESAKGKVKPQTGYDSWGGIPLSWATELFLGRIPCPSAAVSKMAIDKEDELTISTEASVKGPEEQFVYRFRYLAGSPWPEALHWEKKGPMAVQVDFVFDDPEKTTGSPGKWEAKSSRGEVKVRWRERDISK